MLIKETEVILCKNLRYGKRLTRFSQTVRGKLHACLSAVRPVRKGLQVFVRSMIRLIYP